MLQIKRFWKPLSLLVNVAAFGTNCRRKLSASFLLALAAASVSTAAHALKVQVFVNGALAVDTAVLGQADLTGPGDSGTLLTVTNTVTIPNGNYPTGCTTGVNCLLNVAGGTATATIIKNTSLISTSTSITTKVNVSGNFKYLGSLSVTPTTPLGGSIEIVTSNKFILPTGVWTTANKGNAKVYKLASGQYVANATCFPNTSTIQAGSCTFGRSYNATDEGYVYRGANLPAGGVVVELRSEVGFFDSATAVNPVRTEIVGGAPPANPRIGTDHKLSFAIPLNSTYQEDAHFYLGTSLGGAGEIIPCEPLNTGTSTTPGGATFTCANNEQKVNRLKFTKLNQNDLVNLPVTSTDLGASDPGTLAFYINGKFLIDVQPIAVIANTQPEPETPPQVLFPYLGDANNDWNPSKTSGNKQVLALNSYKPDGNVHVNACGMDPANVRISVAGSPALVAAHSFQDALDSNGDCIGRVFFFDYGQVNATIPTSPTDVTALPTKLETCLANPTVALFASGIQLSSQYQLDSTTTRGGKPPAFALPEGCSYNTETQTATCTVEDAEVSGSQLIKCCTSCGG